MLLIFIQVDIQSLQRVMLCNARKLTVLNQLKNVNDPMRQEAVRFIYEAWRKAPNLAA